MLARAQQLIDGALVAELDEVSSALRLLAERNRVIAEGAGACARLCVSRESQLGCMHRFRREHRLCEALRSTEVIANCRLRISDWLLSQRAIGNRNRQCE